MLKLKRLRFQLGKRGEERDDLLTCLRAHVMRRQLDAHSHVVHRKFFLNTLSIHSHSFTHSNSHSSVTLVGDFVHATSRHLNLHIFFSRSPCIMSFVCCLCSGIEGADRFVDLARAVVDNTHLKTLILGSTKMVWLRSLCSAISFS